MDNQLQDNSLSKSIYPWIVWTISACFFFYKYLVQVSPSVMTSDLMRAFDIQAAWLGNLSAFYFYAYLLMQIPVGILLDRYSPRLLTTIAIFICSSSTLVFAANSSLFLACISRAFMGFGAAFAAVSCFKLAALWFPPKKFALVSGMFMTAAMLGAIGGQMPLSYLVQHIGWRSALNMVGFIGIALGVTYYIVIRDKSSSFATSTSKNVMDVKKDSPLKTSMNIIKQPQAIWLSLYSGLAFAPVSVFGGLWGGAFLESAYNLSTNNAAFSVSCIFMGFACGAPLLGWLSDYMGRRKPILYYGIGIALVCLTLVIYGRNLRSIEIEVLLFVFGFGSSGFFTCFAMIRELFSVGLIATVLGLMNTFDSLCEALFEPLVGAVLDNVWSGQLVDGVPVYSIHNYHVALCLLPISMLLALFTLFYVEETYCNSSESDASSNLLFHDKDTSAALS